MINHLDIVNKTIDEQIKQLEFWKSTLNQNVNSAVDLILGCQGRVIVSGVGKSGLIGKKIVATFASTGTPSFFLHPTEAFHGDLGIVKPSDVIILISYSGETDEVNKLVPSLKEFGNKIIAITGDVSSSLAKNSDVILGIKIEKEVCPNNLAPTSSTLINLALGDALAVALMEARNFKPEDFARFHPGGSLGRKLLTKVKHEMRSSELPFVSLNSSLADCLLKMTTSKTGVALVGSSKCLLGIITDGDIRRALLDHDLNTKLIAKEIMTLNPFSISGEEYIFKAEEVLIERKIKTLVVKNDEEIIGIFELNA